MKQVLRYCVLVPYLFEINIKKTTIFLSLIAFFGFASQPNFAQQAKDTKKSEVKLKKDGTPDKRYKSAPAAGPLKKDGTPDKRFKGNKKP